MIKIQRSFDQSGAKLYLCSTPIGNLQDVSLRLLETLRSCSVVLAEDTRQTRKLLSRYDIHPAQLHSYHEHNAASRAAQLIFWWEQGETVALVTDAGTPGICDPGATACALACTRDVPIVPVPGPSAALAALVGSGLPAQPFTFFGFLPRGRKALAEQLAAVDRQSGTSIFYESPHRLAASVQAMAERWPHRAAVIAREITKRNETFVRGTLAELAAYAAAQEVRGECVIVLGPTALDGGGQVQLGGATAAGNPGVMDACRVERLEQENGFAAAVAAVQLAVQGGESHARAVRKIAAEWGVRRKLLYQATLQCASQE